MENNEHFTVEDCERAGQRLLHIMLTLYDERIRASDKAHSPVVATLWAKQSWP
jgi:hypothetical protein